MAVQIRENDAELLGLLEQVNDAPTRRSADLERRLLANFEGGCHTAFGAWARNSGDTWELLAGLEDEQGWGAYSATGIYEELEKLGPSSGIQFTPRKLKSQEELCREIRL